MARSSTHSPSLLWFFIRHRWGARVWILTLAFVGSLVGVMSPICQKIFLDRVLGVASLDLPWLNFTSPLTAITAAFFAMLLTQALGLFVNYLCVKEGTLLAREVSERLYRKMLGIRPDSMGATTVGEIVSLFATDVAGSTALVDQVLPMAVMIIFNFAFAPLAVYWISDIPMWATLAVMFAIVLLNVFMAFRQSQFFTRFKQLAAERTGIVNEWVQTIRMLRILGWIESFENKIYKKRVEETENRVAMVTNGQLMNSFGSSINFMINLIGVASLIYLSGKPVSPSVLFAMLWIFGVFMARAFRQMPWFFMFTLDSVTSMRRLERFLDRPSDAGEVEAREVAEDAHASRPLALSVRGLNLRIGEKQVLSDVDFDVKPGEFVAIVGEVGSGKSLLILSLVGETGATFDRFEIDGRDVRELDVLERRRAFGFVPQEGFVMSASLRENIAFRYEPPPGHDEEIFAALETAQFKIRTELQGPGLETEIGERGVNMSGGQRQRVSLARARYIDRPIVLLDDCLSAVDVDTERNLVRDLLDGAWRGRTRLLVTHRLSVLSRVDRIFFLDQGRIVDSGTFDELLRRSEEMQKFIASVQRGEGRSPNAVAEVEPESAGVTVESAETDASLRRADGETETVS